jgi:hypothetical protein
MRLSWLSGTLLAVTPMIGCGSSFGPAPTAGPRAVVQEYCQLDFDGGRLGAGEGERIFSFVTWEAEPGWDTAVIVSSFDVHEARQDGPRAQVTVDYRVVGRFEGRPPTVLGEASERAEFRLIQRGNSWLIDHGQIPPHASLPAFIAHLETLIQQARNDKRQSALVRDLERLRALK